MSIFMNIHEHTKGLGAQQHDRPRVKNSVIEFSFNAWMTHSATIIFNTTTENTSDEPCHDSENVINMVSQLILSDHTQTQLRKTRIKIVIQVSKYTNIFGMVQMLEAFCLAPFVGAVIDFSGSVLSVNRFKSVFKRTKISKYEWND